MSRLRCPYCTKPLTYPAAVLTWIDRDSFQRIYLYHPPCDSPSGRLRQRAIRQFLKRNRDRLGVRIEGNLIISNTGGEGHAAINAR